MMTAKEHAIGLYMEAIRDGDPRPALDTHIGDRYTQHSTGVKDGKEGFLEFFEPFLERNPVRQMEIRRALQDGPHVFLHAYQSLNDGEAQWVTADFFDSDADGKIVEHWDVIAPYNPLNVSCRSNIDGPTEVTDRHKTASNKAMVIDFIERCLIRNRLDLLKDYIDPTHFDQHSPMVGDGLDQMLKEFDPTHHKLSYQDCVLAVAEGNFVATLNRARWDETDQCQCDLFRLENDLIVEHWELAETIPPRAEWANSGKF
ncbi:MAG: nuclear transport factor 2 family protein [Pseudomonadota bacterium]